MYVIDPITGRQIVRKLRRRTDDVHRPHELTFSCFRRYQFLNRDRTREWFIESLLTAKTNWCVDVRAYVLMPEHTEELPESIKRFFCPEFYCRVPVPFGRRES